MSCRQRLDSKKGYGIREMNLGKAKRPGLQDTFRIPYITSSLNVDPFFSFPFSAQNSFLGLLCKSKETKAVFGRFLLTKF